MVAERVPTAGGADGHSDSIFKTTLPATLQDPARARIDDAADRSPEARPVADRVFSVQ
jgi:hypothetical protein